MLSTRPNSILLLATVCAASVLLGGCKTLSGVHLPHWGHKDPAKTLCEPYAPYLAAKSVPVIRVGDGLTPPNTKNSLKVPDTAGETHAHTEKEGCLDAPPSFDSGAAAKPGADKAGKAAKPEKPAHDGPAN